MQCLYPPLTQQPSGHWFCPVCKAVRTVGSVFFMPQSESFYPGQGAHVYADLTEKIPGCTGLPPKGWKVTVCRDDAPRGCGALTKLTVHCEGDDPKEVTEFAGEEECDFFLENATFLHLADDAPAPQRPALTAPGDDQLLALYRATPRKPPPGWVRRSDYGKTSGYRGPGGANANSLEAAWREAHGHIPQLAHTAAAAAERARSSPPEWQHRPPRPGERTCSRLNGEAANLELRAPGERLAVPRRIIFEDFFSGKARAALALVLEHNAVGTVHDIAPSPDYESFGLSFPRHSHLIQNLTVVEEDFLSDDVSVRILSGETVADISLGGPDCSSFTRVGFAGQSRNEANYHLGDGRPETQQGNKMLFKFIERIGENLRCNPDHLFLLEQPEGSAAHELLALPLSTLKEVYQITVNYWRAASSPTRRLPRRATSRLPPRRQLVLAPRL